MRQESNNEMDLLLRRLSRRQGVSVSDEDSLNDSDHLDADELNSYAENSLPTAARARYTEHLAECSKCRELVVQLSGSVPVVAARETVTAAAPSGLGKFLASFFSPMVLRYAVPALGVIVVAAIGFVVFRSSSSRQSLARVDTQMQQAPAPAQSEQPTSAFYDDQGRTKSPAEGDVSARKAESSKATQPVTTTPQEKPQSGDVTGQRRDEPAPSTERQAVANEAPPPAPKAAPAATVDEMQVNVEGRRANELPRVDPAARDLAKLKDAEDSKEQQKKTETSAARRAAKTPAAAPQTDGATSAYMVQEREKDSNKDDGVLRTAGGRRFRKQNGVWVDTAYDSGSAITNVTRGSEQYRALIADEPTIKKIADELDGTIVVVWKGRTYRIR